MDTNIRVTSWFLYTTCLSIAAYVTFLNIHTYLKNEDSSSFKIKGYHIEKVNHYPDVSICFRSSGPFSNEKQGPLNISTSAMKRMSKHVRDIFDMTNVLSENRFLSHKMATLTAGYLLPNSTFAASEDQMTSTWLGPLTPCVTWKIPYTPHEVLHLQTTYLLYNLRIFCTCLSLLNKILL